jgi:hypothetical protein
MGKKRKAYRLLVGKPEGSRPLRRLRRRWLDNIRMHIVEVMRTGLVWLRRGDRWRVLVNAVLNLRVP